MIMHECAMCCGRFPGPGIKRHGEIYCCDKCAEGAEHKLRMMSGMALKLVGLVAIAVGAGFLLGQRSRNE